MTKPEMYLVDWSVRELVRQTLHSRVNVNVVVSPANTAASLTDGQPLPTHEFLRSSYVLELLAAQVGPDVYTHICHAHRPGVFGLVCRIASQPQHT